LGAYCALYAQRFLELSAIRCFLDMAANLPEHPLDSRTCHGLFLAFKEALNNGVRHFQATEARLRLRVDSGELRFEITDNGRGLEGRLPAPGMDGLTGMQERLRGLGGTCRIESQAGQGTTVEFCLPLNAVAAHGAAPTADGSRTTQKGSLLRRLARLAFIRVHKPVFDEQHSGNR
jgi:glucose-6-phosphate-specific signal transduction histidine kinase